jgi:hypothetical protein
MSKMKLIMENFRKNMKNEAWSWGGSKEDAESFVRDKMKKGSKAREATEQAIITAVNVVRDEILDVYDQQFATVQDIVDSESTELDIGELKILLNRAFGDAHAQFAGTPGTEAAEEDMLRMIDSLDVFEDDETDALMPSDQEEPPGYMPGDGGNY